MYRFTPSTQPVANPLQGLIGLGAVSSYYRVPTYSCAQNANVIEYASGRCASRSPNKEVDYKLGYSTTMKGTKDSPYQVTIKDIYNNFFDSCRVKAIKVCPQPPIVVTPEELVVLPVPTHPVPTKPPIVVNADELTQLPVPIHPTPTKPPIVADADELIQIQIPQPYPAPVKPPESKMQIPDEVTPVTISSLPAPSQIVSVPTKSGVVISSPELESEEEPESNSSKYLIGGILLLAVGGGAAYYFMRKKRK
jgi:hypothetical protein